MPLNSDDVRFLNKHLDGILRKHRGWQWMRYFVLGGGVFFILLGLWSASTAYSLFQLDLRFPATHHVTDASTLPVTARQMDDALESARAWGRIDDMMTALGTMSVVTAMFLILVGFNGICLALFRWNHHRRDLILITLLREKCAAELAMPTPSTNSSG